MLFTASQKLPVTAVTSFDNFLLSAQGGSIEIHDLCATKVSELIDRAHIFKQSTIHGFKVFHFHKVHYLIAFGGKDLCVAAIHKEKIIKGENDWIEIIHENRFHDWIQDVAVVRNINESNYQLGIALAHNAVVRYDYVRSTIIEEVHCSDKCILYSAHFAQCCGLSWSDLILFSGTVYNQVIAWKPVKNGNHDIIMRFNGHNGVIFNMHYNDTLKILLSASDDRSIRIWNCDFLKDSEKTEYDDCSLCVMYGHEARIWKVNTFLKDTDTYVVSTAEDGLCIIWKPEIHNSSMTYSIMRKLNFHSNLLSLYINSTDQSLLVGGCDGSIRFVPIEKILETRQLFEAPPVNKDEHGVMKAVMLLTTRELGVLAHTDLGSLLYYSIEKNEWNVLQKDNSFGSYAVVKINKSENVVAIGNTKGFLKLVHLTIHPKVLSSTKFKPFQSKILSINWCQNNLFLTGPGGILLWYRVSCDDDMLQTEVVSSFFLPPAKHRWSTSIFNLSSDAFVCGDRRGSLHVFVEGKEHPVDTHHGVHGKLGVTSVIRDGRNLITTGRDGHWRVWGIDDKQLLLLTKHRAAQGMDWLEGCDVILVKDEQRFCVHGFHGNKFVVWSKYSGDELFSVLCGGGHRSWGFSLRKSHFVFLKAGRLVITKKTTRMMDESALTQPFHSQHINCVQHLLKLECDSKVFHLVATSGEDTKLFLSYVKVDPGSNLSKIRTLRVLDDHLSNVRCIKSLPILSRDGLSEILMVAGGGRALLNVYKIIITKNAFPREVVVMHVTSYTCGSLESEVRLMDVEIWKEDDSIHKLALACSDGKIRLLKMKNLGDISEIDSTSEYQHCFLTVSRFNNFLACGSTDGCVYVMTSFLSEVTSFPCHQSGVNSIAWCEMTIEEEEKILLVTGGDDNAIRVMLIDSSSMMRISSCLLVDAHSAQITGLHLHNSSSFTIMTSSSIDQRITRWKLSVSKDMCINWQQIGCQMTPLSDMASMDVCEDDYFLCGQGLLHLTFQEKIS